LDFEGLVRFVPRTNHPKLKQAKIFPLSLLNWIWVIHLIPENREEGWINNVSKSFIDVTVAIGDRSPSG
jgi:hypothetical protein